MLLHTFKLLKLRKGAFFRWDLYSNQQGITFRLRKQYRQYSQFWFHTSNACWISWMELLYAHVRMSPGISTDNVTNWVGSVILLRVQGQHTFGAGSMSMSIGHKYTNTNNQHNHPASQDTNYFNDLLDNPTCVNEYGTTKWRATLAHRLIWRLLYNNTFMDYNLKGAAVFVLSTPKRQPKKLHMHVSSVVVPVPCTEVVYSV